MKKGLIVIAAIIFLAGCGKETVTTSNDTENTEETQTVPDTTGEVTQEKNGEAIEGFRFSFDNVVIPMNAEAAPIIDALGEPTEYFEAASCAFQGLDKIYTYSGFEINTYPLEDKDYISSVYVMDDSVTTPEGIYLGATQDEVIAAYGGSYMEESGEYIYTKGESKLSFIIEEGYVTAITYSAIVEGLE